MKIYFDTEFMEDGVTIELLSIGLVREDGQTYYAEPAEADRSKANPWVKENVLPYLTGPVKPRSVIAEEIREFVGPRPEFWAWYGSYDWVALCQLYGRMVDLPQNWPMFVMDLRNFAHAHHRTPFLPEVYGPQHHALSDAKWLKDAVKNYKKRGLF